MSMATIAALAAGWLILAFLVGRRGGSVHRSLSPRLQASLLVAALLGLTVAPMALVITVLSRSVAAVGDGSRLSRCGRLILAVLTNPLARPEATLSLLVLAALVIGLVVGVVRTWHSQHVAHRTSRGIRGHIIVIQSPEPAAFTVGLLRPKVVVSRALVDQADPDSLRVVLAHEEAHRRGRHPLMLFLTESVAHGLAYWPLASAARQLRLALEMVADDRAAESVGSRAAVAEAIGSLALVQTAAAVGFEGETVARIRRLLSGSTRHRPFASCTIAFTALFVIAFSGGHALHCSRMSYDALKTQVCPLNMDMARMNS